MSRRLRIAGLISLALHALVLGVAWLFMRHGVPLLVVPDKNPEVELVMVEQKGAGQPQDTAASDNAPPQEQPTPQPPRPQPDQTAQAEDATPSLPPEVAEAEPLPLPPLPPQDTVATAEPPPAPSPPPRKTAEPKPDAALSVFNLGGTDSESNAIAEGKDVIPAKPDKKYRNRPPPYPEDAVLRGEHGTVVLVIHVDPLGLPSGIDVAQSSGYASLDRAALQAVKTWRFLPAVKDGQPIAFDMPMRFVFEFN